MYNVFWFQGDTKNDNWIFAMAVLLSSTLVYNSMGTIDNRAPENLQYPSHYALFYSYAYMLIELYISFFTFKGFNYI